MKKLRTKSSEKKVVGNTEKNFKRKRLFQKIIARNNKKQFSTGSSAIKVTSAPNRKAKSISIGKKLLQFCELIIAKKYERQLSI